MPIPIPNYNASVTIPTTSQNNSTLFRVGNLVMIQGAGVFEVTAIPTNSSLTVRTSEEDNVFVGTNFEDFAPIYVTLADLDVNDFCITTANYTQPASGGSVNIAVNKVTGIAVNAVIKILNNLYTVNSVSGLSLNVSRLAEDNLNSAVGSVILAGTKVILYTGPVSGGGGGVSTGTILVNLTTYVDPVIGDDDTGIAGDMGKPFATVSAAETAMSALSGTKLVLRPGVHGDIAITVAKNVFLEMGATVGTLTISIADPISISAQETLTFNRRLVTGTLDVPAPGIATLVPGTNTLSGYGLSIGIVSGGGPGTLVLDKCVFANTYTGSARQGFFYDCSFLQGVYGAGGSLSTIYLEGCTVYVATTFTSSNVGSKITFFNSKSYGNVTITNSFVETIKSQHTTTSALFGFRVDNPGNVGALIDGSSFITTSVDPTAESLRIDTGTFYVIANTPYCNKRCVITPAGARQGIASEELTTNVFDTYVRKSVLGGELVFINGTTSPAPLPDGVAMGGSSTDVDCTGICPKGTKALICTYSIVAVLGKPVSFRLEYPDGSIVPVVIFAGADAKTGEYVGTQTADTNGDDEDNVVILGSMAPTPPTYVIAGTVIVPIDPATHKFTYSATSSDGKLTMVPYAIL